MNESKIKIKHFRTGPVSANTFIVYREGSDRGFVVDPGGNYKRICGEAAELGVKLTAQLLTHGHFDHCGASAALQRDGAAVYIHALDADKLSTNGNLASLLGSGFERLTADNLVRDGELINLAGIDIRVMHTPGHSSGSCCFILEQPRIIFSGDTLFNMCVGRTDFPDGSARELSRSLNEKLFALDGDYTVYPGHDEFTTLDYERLYNPEIEYD